MLPSIHPHAGPPPSGDAPKREPHLLHFGLKQMLWFVAGVSALLALLVATEGAWPLVIGGTVLLIAAHVFGTLIGTRLRDTSADVRVWRSAAGGAVDEPVRTSEPVSQLRTALPAATMLAESHQAPLRDRIAAAAGALVGFAAGFAAILLTAGDQASWLGVVIGAVACAVIGAWFAWLTTSFGVMTRNAWHDAKRLDQHADPEADQAVKDEQSLPRAGRNVQ